MPRDDAASWTSALARVLPTKGTNFASHVETLASKRTPKPWQWADAPVLVGLERWGIALAKADRVAGVAALVAAAQAVFADVVAAGGDAIDNCGFTGNDSDKIVDGAAVEVQLLRASRWVADPGKQTTAKVSEAFDGTRQLHVWDDDLRPDASGAYWWYWEVGQACSAAILNEGGSASSDSYYDWPPPVCVGRGLVLTILGQRMPRRQAGPLVNAAGKAIAALA